MKYLFLAWSSLVLIAHRVYWTIFPDSLPDTNILASTTNGLHPSCQGIQFQESLSVKNVHDLDTASEIARQHDAPVVFKGFFSSAGDIWAGLYEQHKSHSMRQAQVEIKSFGNMFMAGTRTYSGNVQNVTLESILNRQGNISYYASFASFLSKNSVEKVLGTIPSHYIADTNFISNFESDVIASPIHSTSYVTSYSAQLVGRKLWIWVSPKSMEEDIGIISTHTANFHYQGCEASYLSRSQGMHVSVVEEGDLLIFPPLWGHAVLTQAGPNVMLNLRQVNIWNALYHQPLRLLESFLSTVLLYQRGGHSTSKWNKVQKRLHDQREKHYEHDAKWVPPETTCKNTLSDMLNR